MIIAFLLKSSSFIRASCFADMLLDIIIHLLLSFSFRQASRAVDMLVDDTMI